MNIYSSRRQKVLKSFQGNGMVMFFSGKAPMRSEDEAYDFSVNRNFYYLTGIDAEDMVLLISDIDGVFRETMYILPYDETLAKWVGGRMLKEEASSISEIKDVQDISVLDDDVASLLNRARTYSNFKCFFDFIKRLK